MIRGGNRVTSVLWAFVQIRPVVLQ